MFCGLGVIFPKALRAKGSRLVGWGSGGRGRGRPWRELGVSAPMQRGVHFFEEIAFSCSVGRWCHIMRGAETLRFPLLGRHRFSCCRSRALFSDVPWPSVTCL